MTRDLPHFGVSACVCARAVPVCVYVCLSVYAGSHVEVRGQSPGVGSLLSLTHVLGTKLRSSGTVSDVFTLNHLAFLIEIFLMELEGTGP